MRVLLALVFCISALAQDTLPMSASAPSGVIPRLSYSGQQGQNEICYWVVTNYPRGKSPAQTPTCVFTGAAITAGNPVVISWNAPTGATSYDILKTLTEQLPGSCTCLLVSGTTATTVMDTGAALSPYTLSNIASPVSGGINLNNKDYPTPRYIFLGGFPVGGFSSLFFPDGTSFTTAASGSVGINQLTGDVTAGPGVGSQVATLATVNAGPGSCGDTTHVCGITTNGKGLVTTQSATAITFPGITQLTGDVTAGPGAGSQAATLATVNAGPGSCGDGTHVCTVTTNGKGLVTSQSATAITGAPPTGSAGGVLSGSYPNPSGITAPSFTVGTLPAQVAGRTVYVTDGANNSDCTTGGGTFQVLCISNGTAYLPIAYAGNSTAPPPPAVSAIGDFWVVRTSPTVLTIGQNCSTAFPCRVAFGTIVFQITAPATATISAGSATAYIYVSSSQVLSVGTNGDTVVCSGCTTVGSISAFPADSIPLWNWTASSGTWSLAGGTDQRVIVQKGADPLAQYILTASDTQLKNGVTLAAQTGSSFNAVMTRRACQFDNDTQSATVLTAAQFSGHCVVPFAATIVEVDVSGGTQTLNGTPAAPTFTGTSSIQIGKQGASNSTGLLSGALATASGIACAKTSTSATCVFNNGMTSSNSITISTTAIAAGDELYISAATADGVQTWYNVTVWFTVN